MNKMNVI